MTTSLHSSLRVEIHYPAVTDDYSFCDKYCHCLNKTLYIENPFSFFSLFHIFRLFTIKFHDELTNINASVSWGQLFMLTSSMNIFSFSYKATIFEGIVTIVEGNNYVKCSEYDIVT